LSQLLLNDAAAISIAKSCEAVTGRLNAILKVAVTLPETVAFAATDRALPVTSVGQTGVRE